MKSYIKRGEYLVLLVLLLIGCRKVIVPDIEESEPCLVIEGYYSTQQQVHQVNVTYSKSFTEKPYFQGAEITDVYVEDDQGLRIQYYKANNFGLYQTSSTDLDAAEVGRTYTLVVEDKEGNIYKSVPQKIVPCSPVDSIYWEVSEKTVMAEDIYGAMQEQLVKGVTIYADARATQENSNFFFYQWQAFEQHRTMVTYQLSVAVLYKHRRLRQDYSNAFVTANAEEMNDRILRRIELVFIPKAVMENYTAEYDANGAYGVQFTFDGLIFGLQQYSLSADAYNFWHESEEQLQASGKLFDPVASQLNSNIVCVTDSAKKVFGVFTAADVTNKYYYLYYNGINSIYSAQLNAFPQIRTDTNTPDMPEGWIIPPI